MILEDGLEFQQFSITPVDVQLLESKTFQIEDIARIYRIPQHLIGKLIKQDAEVKDESIIDTLLDLANYSIMTIIEMENMDKE